MVRRCFIAGWMLVLVISCNKLETVSPVPHIEYVAVESSISVDGLDAKNRKIVLHFSLTDGDGNFGLTDQDTSILKNCFIQTYFYENAVWSKSLFVDYRIPYLGTSSQQPVVIKAEAIVTLEYPIKNYLADSVYYELWVTDRAGNQSNTIQTPHFLLSDKK